MAKEPAGYWDTLLPANAHPQPLWRVHSDVVNSAWLAQRLLACERLLKTDLFDEALAAGLFPLLSTRARVVVGIDVAATTARIAHAGYPGAHVAATDVRALPFATGCFDTVISNSTLDHFASVAEIGVSLAELHRVLRPGGELLLTLDNLANPVVALRNALPFGPLNALGIVPHRVGATCTPRQLTALLHTAHFDVREIGAILHCPRVLAVAGAAVVNRLGSARAQQRYLRWLMPFEHLASLPTRYLTGYFIAVVARKS
jgi:SAM-dependent methyltransferase